VQKGFTSQFLLACADPANAGRLAAIQVKTSWVFALVTSRLTVRIANLLRPCYNTAEIKEGKTCC